VEEGDAGVHPVAACKLAARILDRASSDHNTEPDAPQSPSELYAVSAASKNPTPIKPEDGPADGSGPVYEAGARRDSGDLPSPLPEEFSSARSTTSSHTRTHSPAVPKQFSVAISTAYPASTSSSQHPAPASDASSAPALPTDAQVEATIQQAIKAERDRIKMAFEREVYTRALIASHDEGRIK
jgi:hypothetical protein